MSLSVDERDELRSTARGLLSREASAERVRATVSEAPGFDRVLWDQMVELGWTSMHVPAEFGGSGAGYGELAVVLHELGRAIVPSPFLASAVLATSALTLSDNEQLAGELLTALVSGASLGSVALASAEGSCELRRSTVEWERSGESVRLQGSAGFVLDADIADFLVVAAIDPDECPVVVAVDRATPGVRIEHAATVDATRRLFTVVFDEVVVADDRMLCEPGVPAAELFERIACRRRDRRRVRRDRSHGAGARTRRRLREGARPVREADRVLPGGQAPLRQHRDRGRGQSGRRPRRRGSARRRSQPLVHDRPRSPRRTWARRARRRARSRCGSTAGSGSRGSTSRICT